MNLWIRSQNREQLSKPNKLYVKILNEERYEILSGEGFYVLGTYKTKERALEVLDEVETLLKPRFMITENKELVQQENGSYYCPPLKEIEIPPQDTIFYEMPKE